MTEGATLRLTEIFHSLQGESSLVGLPTVFIRLTGCPLRCVYCDTDYAFHGGSQWSFSAILDHLTEYSCKRVCVTGGEPLAQPLCFDFLTFLADQDYAISLETSGAMSVEKVDARVVKILDLKTPSSGEVTRNLWDNIEFVTKQDQIKFVIADDDDFDWSVSKVMQYDLLGRASDVLFSPVHDSQPLDYFAERVLRTGLPIRMQTQLHKMIWADAKGH